VSSPGALPASRVLVVGSDADVSISLHLHLERAGYTLYCLPTPGELEALLRTVAPHLIVLLLPAVPDASWGNTLAITQSAAKVGVRVVLIAPSRELVEPLAAVAGAEKALSRAEALTRPMSVVERLGTVPGPVPTAAGAPATSRIPPLQQEARSAAPSRPHEPVDLMALIDEELVDEPKSRPSLSRVEVNVSLVSEHNFYVGPTRRIDSGGVFISTMLPPPVGTQLQIRLGLADGRKIDLEGVVAYVREKNAISGRQPAGCGVRLVSIPGWAIDAIDRFLLARQPIVFVPA
jgi:hypothetical protein